uniref:MFS domain-containing protein n=1 Tax=Steinernema glaseri TaxID=37863 RepID=A0A1I7XW55_9BILA
MSWPSIQMDSIPPKKQSTATKDKVVLFGTRTRFFIIALLLLCLTSIWCNVLTYNFAVICMHPHRNSNGSYTSLTLEMMKDASIHDDEEPHVISFSGNEIIWYTANDKSLLVAVVAAGALAANFGAVYMINQFGIRMVFGLLGLLSAIATILIPSAARLGLRYFLMMRFLQGVAFSANFAVIGSFSNKWTYHKQHGMFVSALVAHLQLSPALTMPLSSMLCTNFGWPSVYYSHGAISLVIFVFFIMVYRNSPNKHPLVGNIELKKISVGKESISKAEQKSIPYAAILKSWPVWAIWVAGIGAFSTVNMMSLFAPTYLHAVLGFEVKHTGISAAIPPLLQFLIKLSCGIISDKLRSIPETKKLKYFNTAAFLGSAVCLAALAFMDPQYQLVCLALLAGSTGFLGLTTGGFFKSPPLIARHYAHFVMGNVAFAITTTMLLIPFLISGLAPDNTALQWRYVFIIIAIVMLLSNAFFVMFGSGSVQPWAMSQSRMQSSTDVMRTTNKVAPVPQNGAEKV